MSLGRPSLYNEANAIAAAEAGGGMDVIAEKLGVGRRRLEKWSHRFPAFKEAVERGRKADARRAAQPRPYPVDYGAANAMRQQLDAMIASVRAAPLPPPEPADPREAELAAALERETRALAPRPDPLQPAEAVDRLGTALALARARPYRTIGEGRRQSSAPPEPSEQSPVDADPEDDPAWQRANTRHRLVRPKSYCAELLDPRDAW